MLTCICNVHEFLIPVDPWSVPRHHLLIQIFPVPQVIAKRLALSQLNICTMQPAIALGLVISDATTAHGLQYRDPPPGAWNDTRNDTQADGPLELVQLKGPLRTTYRKAVCNETIVQHTFSPWEWDSPDEDLSVPYIGTSASFPITNTLGKM